MSLCWYSPPYWCSEHVAIQFIWVNKLWYQSSGTWSDGVAYFNRLIELASLVLNILTQLLFGAEISSHSEVSLAAELSWVLVLAGLVWHRPTCAMRMRRKIQKWKWNLWPVPFLCVLWWHLFRNNSSVWSCILEKCILKQKSEWSIGCSSAVSPGPTHAALQQPDWATEYIYWEYRNIGIYSVSQFSFKIHGNKKYFCYLKIDLNCIS